MTQSSAAAAAAETDGPFLRVQDLKVTFPTEDGPVTAVQGLSYSVEKGKTLGIVGESGSGKSVSSMAVMGLHDTKSAQISGSNRVGGTEVVGLSESRMRGLRGNAMAMIFQDALAALHPFYKIGAQLEEAYLVHHSSASKRDARRKAIEMLDRVGIPQPDRRVDDYPHQFSGGMRQRAMIAMGLVNDPSLLIADEPTTALDVTVQAQVMSLLSDLQREMQLGLILITHDMGVVADVADKICVMYAGNAVEQADVYQIYEKPAHPYTKALLESIPRVDMKGQELAVIRGLPPVLTNIPQGCAFHPRCRFAQDNCKVPPEPPHYDVDVNRVAACHYWREVIES